MIPRSRQLGYSWGHGAARLHGKAPAFSWIHGSGLPADAGLPVDELSAKVPRRAGASDHEVGAPERRARRLPRLCGGNKRFQRNRVHDHGLLRLPGLGRHIDEWGVLVYRRSRDGKAVHDCAGNRQALRLLSVRQREAICCGDRGPQWSCRPGSLDHGLSILLLRARRRRERERLRSGRPCRLCLAGCHNRGAGIAARHRSPSAACLQVGKGSPWRV
jgi:hypothetical protein